MIVVAIVANWIRIFGLIAAGHYLDKIYNINDHYLEGWLFFAAIMFVMMAIGLRFRDPVSSDGSAAAGRIPATASPPSAGAIAYFFAFVAVTAAIGAGYPAYAKYRAENAPPIAAVRIAFPDAIGGWRASAAASDWRIAFNGADAQATGRYRSGSQSVDLFVAYYQHQGEGRELVAHSNRVYDNDTWRPQRESKATASIGGAPVDVSATYLSAGQRQRLVWHVYWIDGQYIRSPVLAKLLQAKASLLFGDPRAGVVAASSDDVENTEALETILRALPPFPSLVVPRAAGR